MSAIPFAPVGGRNVDSLVGFRADPSTDNATARKQILEAAAELFTNRGFHATSVREIGDHLGIGKS